MIHLDNRQINLRCREPAAAVAPGLAPGLAPDQAPLLPAWAPSPPPHRSYRQTRKAVFAFAFV